MGVATVVSDTIRYAGGDLLDNARSIGILEEYQGNHGRLQIPAWVGDGGHIKRQPSDKSANQHAVRVDADGEMACVHPGRNFEGRCIRSENIVGGVVFR